jgi:hypothetical protein
MLLSEAIEEVADLFQYLVAMKLALKHQKGKKQREKHVKQKKSTR